MDIFCAILQCHILWVSNYIAFDVPCAGNKPWVNPILISIEWEDTLDIFRWISKGKEVLLRTDNPLNTVHLLSTFPPWEVCMKEVTKGEGGVLVSNIQLSPVRLFSRCDLHVTGGYSCGNEPSFVLPYLWDMLTFVMLTEVKPLPPPPLFLRSSQAHGSGGGSWRSRTGRCSCHAGGGQPRERREVRGVWLQCPTEWPHLFRQEHSGLQAEKVSMLQWL